MFIISTRAPELDSALTLKYHRYLSQRASIISGNKFVVNEYLHLHA